MQCDIRSSGIELVGFFKGIFSARGIVLSVTRISHFVLARYLAPQCDEHHFIPDAHVLRETILRESRNLLAP